MSDVGLNAELNLDSSAALAEVDRLEQALAAAVQVEITADAGEVTSATESAVDNADTLAMVDGDAGEVTSATENAVDNADTLAQVDGDAGEVTSATEAAVDNADTLAMVDGDAGQVTSATEAAVDNADTIAQVDGDAGQVTSATEAAVDNADTTAQVGADASGVTGAVENAVQQADAVVRVQVDTAGAQAAMAGLGGSFRTASGEAAGLDASAGRATRGISSQARVAAGVVGTVLGGSFIKVGVDYNTLLQTSSAAFESIMGDARQASAMLDELMDFAQGSPFPRQAFIEATQILLSFGFEADRVTDSLQAIQDAVAATGQSSEAINEIALILGQVNSTGRLGADTFNQLGYRGINAAELIAEQFGTTEAAIRDMTQRGTLDAQEALDALVVGMGENFAGAAEGVAQTWLGAVDRIKAALRDLSSAMLVAFIDPAGGGVAVQFANDLADALRRLEADLVPFVQTATGGLAPVLEAVGQDLLPALVDALLAAAPLISATGSSFQVLAPTLQIVAAAIDAIPAPVLTAVAAFAAMNRLGVPRMMDGIGRAFTNVQGRVRALNPETVALTRGLQTTGREMLNTGRASSQFQGWVRGAGTQIGTFARTAQQAPPVLTNVSDRFRGIDAPARQAGTAVGGVGAQFTATAAAARGMGDPLARTSAAFTATGTAARGTAPALTSAATAARGTQTALQGTTTATAAARTQAGLIGPVLSGQALSWRASGTAAQTAGVQVQQSATMMQRARSGARQLGTAVGGLAASAFTPATAAMAAATAAIMIWSQRQQDAAQKAAEVEAAVSSMSSAFDQLTSEASGQTDVAAGIAGAWEDMVSQGDDIAEKLEGLALSGDEVAEAFLGAGDMIDMFHMAMQRGGDFGGLSMLSGLTQLQDALEGFTHQQIRSARTAEIIDAATERRLLGMENTGHALQLVTGYTDRYTNAQNEEIDAELRRAQAQGAITTAQAEAVRGAEDQAQAYEDLGQAIEGGVRVQEWALPILDTYAGATGATADAQRDFADAALDFGAIQEGVAAAASDGAAGVKILEDALAGVGGEFTGLESVNEAAATGFGQVALAAHFAGASTEELEGLAQTLGVSVTDLEPALEDAAAAILGFRDSAVEHFQSAADVAAGLGEDFSLEGWRDELERTIEAQAEFGPNLQQLVDAGFHDLAQVAAQRGPEFTAELVGAFEDGRVGTLEELDGLVGDLDQQVTPELLATLEAMGLDVSVATGEIGGIMTDKFGDALDMNTVFQQESAATLVEAWGELPKYRTTGIGLAAQVNSGADTELVKLPGMVVSRLGVAKASMDTQQGIYASAGSGLAKATDTGLAGGLNSLPGTMRRSTASAVAVVAEHAGTAKTYGGQLGAAIGQGVKGGIDGQRNAVASAAANMVAGVVAAARGELKIYSPSRVFMEIGDQVGEGLTMGMLAARGDVASAADRLASATLFDPVGSARLAGEISAAARGTTAAAAGATTVTVEPGAVVINLPSGVSALEARRAGERAAGGFMDTLAGRSVRVAARTA